MSLWRVSSSPLRSSLKSLSQQQLQNTEDLEANSILAFFSLVEEKCEDEDPIDFDFPVESFKSLFSKESFERPLTLPNGTGFCFILLGNKSSALSRARCISFTQVVASRPIQPGKYLKFDRAFDLFPALTQFSLRFPVSPPPFTRTSFLPTRALLQVKSSMKIPELKWTKVDKQSRWRSHLSEIIPGLFVGSKDVALNGDLLRRNSITHIVNTCEHVCQSAPGFIQLNFRMNDGGGDSIFSTIWRTIVFIDEAFEKSGAVLVHCQEGVSRSTSLIIGYLIVRNGYDYKTAFNIVRSKRRVASPNPKFIAQLMQLAEVCGTATTRTCFFSKEKQIPFQIIKRKDEFIPFPLTERIPENANGCFVMVDFSESSDIGLYSDGDYVIIHVSYGSDSTEEERKVADQLVSDLKKCIRVAPEEEEE